MRERCQRLTGALILGGGSEAKPSAKANLRTLARLPLHLFLTYQLHFNEEALGFYGVSFRYAPTPQAKGKIERDHQTWQHRLLALFASEVIANFAPANELIVKLLDHRNIHETHRELAMTPQRAWDKALEEKRSALRRVPTCP